MNHERINQILNEWLKDFEGSPITSTNERINQVFCSAVIRKAIKNNKYDDVRETIENNLTSPLEDIRNEAKELLKGVVCTALHFSLK